MDQATIPGGENRNFLEGYVLESELAEAWDTTTKTLKRYRDEPDGLPHLRLGGRIYYRVASVRKWLEAREHNPNPRRRRG